MMFPWILEHFLVCFSLEGFELEAHLPLTPFLLHLKLKVIDFVFPIVVRGVREPSHYIWSSFLTSHILEFSSIPIKPPTYCKF